MNADEADWLRVGQAIEARMKQLRLHKAELQRRARISDKTLNGYLRGAPIVREDKQWALCAALKWSPDSIDRILAGQLPAEAVPVAAYEQDIAITTAGRSGATLEDLEAIDPEAAAKVRADIEFYLRRAQER